MDTAPRFVPKAPQSKAITIEGFFTAETFRLLVSVVSSMTLSSFISPELIAMALPDCRLAFHRRRNL